MYIYSFLFSSDFIISAAISSDFSIAVLTSYTGKLFLFSNSESIALIIQPAYMALEYDIYQNYSMTLSDLINTILEDETSEIQSYSYLVLAYPHFCLYAH